MTLETILALSIPILVLLSFTYLMGYASHINKSEKEISKLKEKIEKLEKEGCHKDHLIDRYCNKLHKLQQVI